MVLLVPAALLFAVLSSAIAVTDMVTVALTGHSSAFGGEGPSWAAQLSTGVHGVMFALLAVVLATRSQGIDAGSRGRRWLRRTLVLLFVFLAVPQVVGGFVPLDRVPEAWTIPVTIGFVLGFPVSAALGITLLRRPGLRLPALMLASVAVALVAAILLGVVRSGWAHPALAEVPQYLGVALLGTALRPDRSRVPEQASRPGAVLPG